MKILFICKANRFRSKVAEAYFKKINKNIVVNSAGLIEMNKPLTSHEKSKNKFIYNKFGLKLDSVSRGLKVNMLRESDRIIVAANNIGKQMFDDKEWKDKVEYWDIEDEKGGDRTQIRKTVKAIMSKVDKLNRELK